MKLNNTYFRSITGFALTFAITVQTFAFGPTTPSAAKSLTEDQRITHVLNRLGFGSRPGDVERVKAIGIQKYIDQQLDPALLTDAVADGKVKNLDIFGLTTSELFQKYPNPAGLLLTLNGGRRPGANQPVANQPGADAPENDRRERAAKLREIYQKYDLKPATQILPQISANRILRAVYSERQLEEVMVDFWQNHFNVFAGKAAVRWYIPSYERDVLRKNALGNFKDLVVGTAQHPAMLFYLDNFESVSPNAKQPGQGQNAKRLQQMMDNGGQLPARARNRMKEQLSINDAELDQRLAKMRETAETAQKRPKRGINENYARELMELHTLGVDGGYSQADIVEVAKSFTGWTIADPRGYRRSAAYTINGTENKALERLQRQAGVPDDLKSGEFYFNAGWHESGAKTVLGQKIDEGGVKDGLKVIDVLVSNPATAKFIARKLAVKFVSDNPSEALVGRVADSFQRSRGDIKTTLRTLFTDKEFFAVENYRAKIKSPFELAISSIRAIGADTAGGAQMMAMLNKLGEVPYGYQAPTGYPDTAEDWVNTGALLERLNFAIALSSNQIPGTKVNLARFDGKSSVATLDKTIEIVLDGEVSAATRSSLVKQLEQPLPTVKAPVEAVEDDDLMVPNMREGQQGGRSRQARLLAASGDPAVFKVVSLVLGSPEFQRQ